MPDEVISQRFLYFDSDQELSDSDDLIRPLLAAGGRLAVLNPLLWLHGCDPDRGAQIEAFMRRVVCPPRAVGAAVIVSDNVAKAKESRGAWAVGSERKNSVVDVQLGMSAITPFGRGRTGRFKLMCTRIAPPTSPARSAVSSCSPARTTVGVRGGSSRAAPTPTRGSSGRRA